MFAIPRDDEKKAVWEAYRAGRPVRVPLMWGVNRRVVLLDPELNTHGFSFEEAFTDARAGVISQIQLIEHTCEVLGTVSDAACELPDVWRISFDNQNVYDAAYFGAPVRFSAGQVPCTEAFMTLDDVDDFLARDFSRPLENPWLAERLAAYEEFRKFAAHYRYRDRAVEPAPFEIGFDGPLTVATNLFGSDVFMLLAAEPEKAARLFGHITRAAITRNKAIGALFGGWRGPDFCWLADDSIQLIGCEMYEELVLPAHELWYSAMSDTTPESGRRGIHLCGDATRHFPTIRMRLGVTSFDTGFPVDHGRLRDELGEDVEISGGPRVDILKNGTPEQCAEAAGKILASGVMRGGRFILREGNNLPPCVPIGNLRAVYEVCLEVGRYSGRYAERAS